MLSTKSHPHWQGYKSKVEFLASVIFLIIILFQAGCAKRGTIVKCPKEDYENFLSVYISQCNLDSLSGNGDYEIRKSDDIFFGNFSIFYSKNPLRWGITLYGIFGVVLSQIEIKNDSFNIYSPLLDESVKGSVRDFSIEDYTGIPISPLSVPLLTTGRVPLDTLQLPSYCIEKNENLIEFFYESGNNNEGFGWVPIDKKIDYYICQKKGRKDFLKVKFSDFKNVGNLSFPHSIFFIYAGMEETYFKLNYRYIEVK